MNHLAIYSKKRYSDYIDTILNGDVSLDIKWMYSKVAPFEKLHKGDIIFIKESSGPVVGKVKVKDFEYIEVIHPDQIRDIMKAHFDEMGFENEDQLNRYAAKKVAKRYGTLIKFKDPVKFKHSVKIQKLDRRVWIADYILPVDLQIL